SHGSVIRKLAFVRRLDGGRGAILRRGKFDQLLGALFLIVTDINVITDEEEKRPFDSEPVGAPDSVPVAQRGGLLNEFKPSGMTAGGVGISRLVARTNHHANLFHAGDQS